MPTSTKFLLLLTSTAPSSSLLRLTRQPLFSLSHRHFRSSLLRLKPSSPSPSLSLSHHHHHFHSPNPLPSQSLCPDFSLFLNNLSASGYLDKPTFQFDALSLPDAFIAASLSFAQDRASLIGRLPRRDVEIVVHHGNAALFQNGDEALTRMRLFLETQTSGVLSSDSEPMVDLMKILLSCASDFIYSEKNNFHNRELLESSVQNLFSELAHLSHNAFEPDVSRSLQNQFTGSNGQISGSLQNHFPGRNEQVSRPRRQNIEMKRGDWVCPRCSFMNFARNTKCLECEEVRPKRQLNGEEWECPQCDFFNYGKNTVCLRCDCKCPGDVLRYGRDNHAYNADIDKRLAENEEKAQRWFSRISQMDGTSDVSSAIEDEDFPEIMPLRKGVNRFVVSTRKTPLERRLADAQYRRNSNYIGSSGISNAQGSVTNDQTPRQALDEIIGHRFAASDSDIKATAPEQNSRMDAPKQHRIPRGSCSSYVPFVPLPADMFAKKPENEKTDESSKIGDDDHKPLFSGVGQTGSSLGSNDYDKSGQSWHPSDQSLSDEPEEKRNEQSDRWFERVAELHNVTYLSSAISDEQFPETMPMRKGENRFVVSKKKDRSLSSPMYKRQMAMEQANNTNYVPFVPFPADYFTKKDTRLSGASMTNKDMGETSNSSTQANLSGKSNVIEGRTSSETGVPVMENQQCHNSQEHMNHITTGGSNSAQNVVGSQFNMTDNRSSRFSWNEDNRRQRVCSGMPTSQQNYTRGGNSSFGSPYQRNESFKQMGNSAESLLQPPDNQNTSNSWSGKSLEGSLVKEPDPLDMSEEAKAERWFRRVAQIKDISELSQIPDEDFPSIMPMRKGVNRFVVSKRKTPLERRLTSTQYRKNLPTVRSDLVKENDSS